MSPDPASLFERSAGIYLDTATYGLPPQPTLDALERALRGWAEGSAEWIEDWDLPAEKARASISRIVGARKDEVALLPSVSVGVGLVAASLRRGERVVVPGDEFTSVLFPLLAAGDRGVEVVQVAYDDLAEAVDDSTTLVALSLVQMQSGKVADLGRVLDSAEAAGARVLVDSSQATPFIDLRSSIERIDYAVSVGYKHLLSPRGVAFMTVRPDAAATLTPWNANWRAADDPYTRYFGGPLTLPESAARFDVSLAWFPWVGAIVSLGLIAGWLEDGTLQQPLAMAKRLAAGLGLEWSGSTLVCAPVADPEAVRDSLQRAGVKAAVRGDSLRLAPHVYTTEADVDTALEALVPLIQR